MSRLKRRVEKLEQQSKAYDGTAIIWVEEDETEDEAKARYFAENPKFREASKLLLIKAHFSRPVAEETSPDHDTE